MIECRRCGANRDGTQPCGTCRADRIEAHVRTLVAGAESTTPRVLKAKADAASALRSFGFTEFEVVEVRAMALDRKSVAECMDRLLRAEAVAA